MPDCSREPCARALADGAEPVAALNVLSEGARVVASSGAFADQIVFLNPDGARVAQLLNQSGAPAALTVVDGSRRQPVELPPHSLGTLLLPRG